MTLLHRDFEVTRYRATLTKMAGQFFGSLWLIRL